MKMKKFPQLPFELNEGQKGDEVLLAYLRAPHNFKYLSNETRGVITGLSSHLKGKGLQSQQKILLDLWPKILTDALKHLKKKDPREYNSKNPGMETFFHAESLGVAELKDVLTGFSQFEGMLYGASPDRYRDHIVHSFRVWIIGHGILEQGLKGRLCSYEDDRLIISRMEWECMWAIVALCHDIGYPLSAVEKINELARDTFKKQGLVSQGDLRFGFRQQMLPFHDAMIKLLASKPVRVGKRSKYLTHLQNKYYVKLLKSFDRLDHGIISSLLVSRGLVYFLESDLAHDSRKALTKEDARQFLIRREILRAIAAHTCPDIYHLNFNTLSFLLYIVDEIQCWGRPTLEELQNNPAKFGKSLVRVTSFKKNDINIEIQTEDKKWEDDQKNITRFQVGKLHRMLRLAVDTPEIVRNRLTLSFKMCNQGGQNCFLELRGGRIKKSDNFGT
jgi:hypothetical protein